MNRSLGLPSALAPQAMAAADASRAWPAADAPPPARQPSGDETPSTSPSARGYRAGRDRMAGRINDVVVRRIFAAGLDLQAALGLIEEHGIAGEQPTAMEHRAASKIRNASGDLDRAIRDLRDILFEGDRE